MKSNNYKGALVALTLGMLSNSTFAGVTQVGETGKNPEPVVTEKEESVFDKIWSLATIYKNKENPIIQELKLRGRYHGQYHWLDSDQGGDDGWENRRSRFGFDLKVFNQFDIRVDAQSNDEFDPFYSGLVDAYIKWRPSKAFNLTLGKQKPQIAYYDFLQSTNAQPTFERSQIFNQLRVDRFVGALVEGKIGNFSYQANVGNNQVDYEFGQFEGGVAFGAGIGYDFASLLGVERAEVRFDWLHSEPDYAEDTVNNRYENIFTTTLWLQEGRYGLVTELFFAEGSQDPTYGDVFGFYVQPTFDIIEDRLQLVGRYSYSSGDTERSVAAQSRYERSASEILNGGRGKSYHSAYLGLQYFIYGDKLKVLAGAEYAKLDAGDSSGGYNGVTYLTGVRLYF